MYSTIIAGKTTALTGITKTELIPALKGRVFAVRFSVQEIAGQFLSQKSHGFLRIENFGLKAGVLDQKFSIIIRNDSTLTFSAIASNHAALLTSSKGLPFPPDLNVWRNAKKTLLINKTQSRAWTRRKQSPSRQ